MDCNSKDDEGYYQGKYLPLKIAKRTAKAMESQSQLTIPVFSSPESILMIATARRALIREQEAWNNFIASQKRRGML